MSRTTLLALATATALVGCPLPQPLPEYAATANTPPRIVVDGATNPLTVIPVPVGCPLDNPPIFSLEAQIRDTNPNLEAIQARWFVNYDPADPVLSAPLNPETVGPAPYDSTLRPIAPFVFQPYRFASVGLGSGSQQTPGGVHLVELVVSNGFRTDASGYTWKPGDPIPNRSPAPSFEVQVYRWVFMNVAPPPSGSCDPSATTTLCAVCPP